MYFSCCHDDHRRRADVETIRIGMRREGGLLLTTSRTETTLFKQDEYIHNGQKANSNYRVQERDQGPANRAIAPD